MPKHPDRMCNELLDAARQHGLQSEPDHECGDLQDIVRKCFETMTPDQCEKIYTEFARLRDDWKR